MSFKIEGAERTNLFTPTVVPSRQNRVESHFDNVGRDSRIGELLQNGSPWRHRLEGAMRALYKPISPEDARAQIDALPQPSYEGIPYDLPPQERRAIYEQRVREYNRRRAEIADDAINNSRPPRREDFKGLNGAMAAYEYREALAAYNAQLAALKRISQEAKANPTRLPPPPPATTPVVEKVNDKDVDAVIEASGYGHGTGAQELADQLRGKSSEYQARFIARLNEKYGTEIVRDLLRGAAGDTFPASDNPPSDGDRRIIAEALGAAYDSGRLPADFVEELLKADENISSPPNNEFTAQLIAESGSRALINEFVDKSLDIARHSDREGAESFVLGAAKAMAGDPEVLQASLEKLRKAGELEGFLEQIAPSYRENNVAGYDYSDTNALATLLNGAARIQPPTLEVAAVFNFAAQNSIKDTGVRDALARIFNAGQNSDFLLRTFAREGFGGLITNEAMTNFLRHAVFDEDAPDADTIVKKFGDFNDAMIAKLADPNVSDAKKFEFARRIGYVNGAILSGVAQAAYDFKQQEADQKHIAKLIGGLVGKAVGMISSVLLPEAGPAAKYGGKAAGQIIGKLIEWVLRPGHKDAEKIFDQTIKDLLTTNLDRINVAIDPSLVEEVRRNIVEGSEHQLLEWYRRTYD